MGGRDVESFEVVPVTLDFGSVRDRKAHSHEDVLELALSDGDDSGVANGQRHTDTRDHDVAQIKAVRFEDERSTGLFEHRATRCVGFFDTASGRLELRTGVLAVFGREGTQRLLQGREN